jgi:hypothetical protein
MKVFFVMIAIGSSAFAPAADAARLTGSTAGYHYFHKRGAGMAEHDAALVECAVATRALVNGSDYMTGITAATGGGLVGALIGGAMDAAEARQGAAANTENCMAVKGWSVIGLAFAAGDEIRDEAEPSLIHARLEPLVNAPAPIGEVLRGPFANELAVGDFKVDTAKDLDKVSLSVRAVKDKMDAAESAAGKLKRPKPPKGVKNPKSLASIKADALAGADPEKAYVIVRHAGRGADYRQSGFTLQRLNRDGTPVVYDGAPILAHVGWAGKSALASTEADDEKRRDYVFEVPPGRWKLGALQHMQYVADLCFGAPSFEIRAGEALYLGAMSVEPKGGYPIMMDLAVGKEILSANPALAAKVKLAEFQNGFLSDCFGSYAYAYEIPGAPFIDYEWLKRQGDAQTPSTTQD